jgi:HD superfamily phosphodiesterase
MEKEITKLYDLVDCQSHDAVLDEIKTIISLLDMDRITEPFTIVYQDIIRLFDGEYPGYRASNTTYHNLEHTIMVTLATVRLIHGSVHGGFHFKPDNVLLGLLAALFHDSGLIQTTQDKKGTGAKYTIGHEKRSVDFMRKNLGKNGFTLEQMDDCARLIKCTNLKIKIADISFDSEEVKNLGKIVGAADLLAQMADRLYLEKLILLFKEFEEAGIPDFESEVELLERTEEFYKNVTQKRLRDDCKNISLNMVNHFRHRWGIDLDLYSESINNNIIYLRSILNNGQKKKSRLFYQKYLRRGGLL